jgi:2-methylisocitrate lyase-like PEP mutase family enzyme
MTGMDAIGLKRKNFRKILKRKSLTVMPGGFSPLYAQLAKQAGFECFFLAGSQLSAFLYGLPDNGIIGLRDLVDHARHMATRSDIPILVDADTGYGNAVNVHFTVQEIIRSGVAAMQIEDQEAPKKSGTLAGRRCISIDEAVGKYQAAVAARNEIDPNFVICARCDALGAEDESFKEAMRRCIAYAEKGGVDFIWLNSIQTREHLRIACRDIPVPVLTCWGGAEATPTLEEYEDMGLRIILYPTMTANAGLEAAWQLLNELRDKGNGALVEWSDVVSRNRWGRSNRRMLLDNAKIRDIEEKYLPKEKRRDYDATWGHRTAFTTDSKPLLPDEEKRRRKPARNIVLRKTTSQNNRK